MFKELKQSRAYFIIASVTILSTFVLWLPFIVGVDSINGIEKPDMSFLTVLSHWDGPLYIVPAKSLYNPLQKAMAENPLGLAPGYFAAHLPGYPLTLIPLAFFVGFPMATVVSSLLAAVALFCFFYYFLVRLKLSSHPLLLTLVLMFITPRFFVVRSVGTPEPMFMLFILASILFFVERKYVYAGLLGACAIITKSPAGLLFVAYGLYFLNKLLNTRTFKLEWLWIGLIPAGLLGVFGLYYLQYGDFWAYFHSGDNLHLLFPPYQVFNFQKNWVDDGWLEEILFVYALYGLTVVELWKYADLHIHNSLIARTQSFMESLKETLAEKITGEMRVETLRVFFYFSLVFTLSIISVQHRDIARYSLPMLPMALITFEKFFTSKRFLIVLILLIPAIYMYAWNFMLWNVAPIADWAALL